MSQNQYRAEKSESHYRKPGGGRPGFSGHQRFTAGGTGKSGGGTGLPPASSNSQFSSQSTNRSFKKSNGYGAQSRVTSATPNSEFRATQNGARAEPPATGVYSAPVAHVPAKHSELHAQRNNRTVSRAPSSQAAPATSDSTAPTTPIKGDAEGGMPLQFGSFSPGFVNGMQIPARTSSAPPNLDEQKRDQARHESFRSAAILPSPVIQQKQSKDVELSKSRVSHPPPQTKRNVNAQVPAAPIVSSSQNSSTFPVPGVQLTVPFQQSPVPVQFGIPSHQISAQGMTASSLQMPIQLSVGSSGPVLPQVFIPNLQAHPLQGPGVMHQGRGMSFPHQIGHQLGSQLGNLHIGPPQYAQQQAGNIGTYHRKSVKITHPETREELRLGKRSDMNLETGSSGPGSHSNLAHQPQPVSFGPSHQVNYFSHKQSNPIIVQTPTSLPLTSTQMASSDQTSVLSAGSSAPEQVKDNPTVDYVGGKTVPHSVSVSSTVGNTSNLRKLSPPTEFLKVPPNTNIKQPKSIPELAASVPSSLTTGQFISPSPDHSVERSHSGDAAQIVVNTDDSKKETLRRSDSIKDNVKKPNKKVQQHSRPQTQEEAFTGAEFPTVSTSREVAKASEKIQIPPRDFTSTSILTSRSMGSENVTSLEETTLALPESHEHSLASAQDSIPDVNASISVATAETTDCIPDGECPDFNIITEPNVKNDFENLIGVNDAKEDGFTALNPELNDGIAELQKAELSEQTRRDLNCNNDSDVPADSFCLDSSKVIDQFENLNSEQASSCNDPPSKESELGELGRVGSHDLDNHKTADIVKMSTVSGLKDNVSDFTSLHVVSSEACSETTIVPEVLTSRTDFTDGQEVMKKVSEKANGDLVLIPEQEPELKDRATLELNSVKSISSKGKKKRKEFLQKADAAGTTSDLYMAYKGPEEKTQSTISSESVDSCPDISVRPVSSSSNNGVISKEDLKSKAEPDDWEDAADISDPELEKLDDKEHCGEDENEVSGLKKYSRDFLLTLSGQCIELPSGFEIANDIVEALMGSKVSITKGVHHSPSPSSGRNTDRASGASRPDYRGNGTVDNDRWNKSSPFAHGLDPHVDIGQGPQGGNNFGPRPGQGVNHGGLRNLRGQTPAQYVGGYLSTPLLPMVSPGGIHRGGSDADRWQRATGFQKGLIPYPQSPMQVMHKAANKYEVRQVTDTEEAKQRQLKAILNKLTPQNFDRLFEQVKEVNIDNAVTLSGVISQIFDKALMEPTFCEMYANFCLHLAGELPDFVEDNEKITFKRLLLNKCQEEFERGEREQAEADRVDGDGEVKLSKEEREERRILARRRMLGNIRLIGELYKKKMLTERIMHACIQKLLGEHQNPDEEDIEALCKLMSTIGEMIDHSKAKEHMDAYFEMMASLSNNMKLSSRLRFMLKDAIDLRSNKWQQRRKIEGPKKIEEVHRDAAQERQLQATRLARAPSFGASPRRGQPLDFGPRASTMSPSPNMQMGAFRGMPSQPRGFGIQDIRSEDRHHYDKRTVSVPLAHKPIDDNAITLGPQGGLARGMSIRGQPMLSGALIYDTSSGHGESRRVPAGPNGYSSVPEWTSHHARQEPMPRYAQERFTHPSACDQPYPQEHSGPYGNRELSYADRFLDKSRPISPATQMQRSSVLTPSASGKVWPEERLRDMSMAAIREFYSARDENEVAQCVRDLNSPNFHSSMVSIWVNDSFERKDRDRDLLAGLLVNLTKPKIAVLSHNQLIEGFDSVLATLEDTITDAPKAAVFLGRIFAKTVVESVVPLGEIGQLLRQGGEEPGRLLQIGLGYEVLQSAFESIKSEKGESILDDICKSSNLQLEEFRHPVATK